MRELPSAVVSLAAGQAGVVSRRQLLGGGSTPNELRSWLRHRLLVAEHPGVYVIHTGATTWLQRVWAAVLLAEPAVAHGFTALALMGVIPRPSDTDRRPVHVAVDARRTVRVPATVVVHRVRDYAGRAQAHLSPPRTRLEDAVLDVAAGASG